MQAEEPRILFVEDDRTFADMMRRMLAREDAGGFRVTWVNHLDQALGFIEESPVFACLLDLSLPDSSGLGTLISVRRKAPELPVVVLTGEDDEFMAMESLRLGALDYLVKSEISVRLIARSLRYAVERKRLGDALKAANDHLEQRVRQRTSALTEANQALKIEILERKRAEHLNRTIRDLGMTLSGISDTWAIQTVCLKAAFSVTGLKAGCVFLTNPESGVTACGESQGLKNRELETLKQMLAYVPAAGPLYLDKKGISSLNKEAVDSAESEFSTVAVLPTTHDGELIGYLVLAGEGIEPGDPRFRPILEAIAANLGIAMARAVAKGQERESQARWRVLAQNSPDYVFALDADAVVRFVNRPLPGLPKEGLLGRSLLKLIPSDSRKQVADCLAGLAAGGESGSFDLGLHLENSPPQHLECRVGKVMHRGIIQGFTISASDVTERKMHELMLLSQERELRAQTDRLAEANTALKVLLTHREGERKGQEERVMSTVRRLVLPFVERLEKSRLEPEQTMAVEMIRSGLEELTSSFSLRLGSQPVGLTARELEVAGLVKEGKTSAEIADFLNISEKAVSFHRGNIRRKLGIKSKKSNLHSHLMQIAQL